MKSGGSSAPSRAAAGSNCCWRECWAPTKRSFQIRASYVPRPGQTILLPGAVEATVVMRQDRFFRLCFSGVASLPDYLTAHAAIPLPPYITRAATGADETRYQTVYARHPGAVAAPTAGLHFDAPLLDALRAAGVETAWVTLHVGAGTFLPVQVDDIATHTMHAEWYRIPAETVAAVERARHIGGRVAAVGTTSLRALESAAAPDGRLQAGAAETALFVRPGYRFRVVDRLLHQFSSAPVDAADARVGVRRLRPGARGLPARGRRGLPLLQLRRRNARRAQHVLTRRRRLLTVEDVASWRQNPVVLPFSQRLPASGAFRVACDVAFRCRSR